MNKPQVSTGAGFISLLGGFLAIYQDVRVVDFFTVFYDLKFGEAVAMIAPFIAGLIAILHDERN